VGGYSILPGLTLSAVAVVFACTWAIVRPRRVGRLAGSHRTRVRPVRRRVAVTTLALVAVVTTLPLGSAFAGLEPAETALSPS
jgi:TRAP-type mannitol/chloroaromatic compound transport system permease large subunit